MANGISVDLDLQAALDVAEILTATRRTIPYGKWSYVEDPIANMSSLIG